MMKARVLLYHLVASLLFVSCASKAPSVLTENNKEAVYEISKVTFIYEDIHPSFWVKPSRMDSLFLSVFIYFKEGIPKKEDIEQIRVYDESRRYWTMSTDEYVTENRNYIGGYTRFRADVYSLNWSVMSLAGYRIEMRMKDGKVYTYRYDPTDPEVNGKNTRNYIYSADYVGRKNDMYIQNIDRAVIKESHFENEFIDVTFSIDDNRVANGEVGFYNKEKKYVGGTAPFKNIYSLEVRKYLNAGTIFNTNGKDNHVRVTKDDIEFRQGRSYSEIEYVIISLSYNDPEMVIDHDVTIFRSKLELVSLAKKK